MSVSVEVSQASPRRGGRAPVMMTCRVCEQAKPSGQMMVYRGKRSTVCRSCTNARKQALLAARKLAYPCPGCERYQACVTSWTPCEAFRAWVEAAC